MKHPFSSHVFSRVRRVFVLSAMIAVAFVLETTPVLAREPARAAAANASPAASTPKPDKALRIYLKTGTKKTYIRGYQWVTLSLNRKISLVESARRGALQMGAVMTLPAERYVYEVNKFFQSNPAMFQMELGQVIQGIAISLKDWEQGGTEN